MFLGLVALAWKYQACNAMQEAPLDVAAWHSSFLPWRLITGGCYLQYHHGSWPPCPHCSHHREVLGSLLYHVIWLLGVYSEARKSKQTAHKSRCVPVNSIPNNPQKWCHYNIRTDRCLCLTKNVTFVSMPNGHLYCLFEDCSTLHSNITLQCTPLLSRALLLNQMSRLSHTHLNIRGTITNCTSVGYKTCTRNLTSVKAQSEAM